MTKPAILIGAGGHARSIIESMGREAFRGYADMRPADGTGLDYLGTDNDILSGYPPAETAVHIAIGFSDGGRSLDLRQRVIERFRDYEAATMISPSAIVTPGSRVGPGSSVMIRAVINRSVTGPYCVINTGAIIEHDCRLGENVFVGPGAVICGEVSVGDNVMIGAGAVLRNGIRIAPGVTIGMGAVVTTDITEPGIYAGCPASRLA